MHQRRLVFILVLAVVAVALLVPAAFAAAPTHGAGMLTYDQAVDYLFAKGYPQNVETYLSNLGTSPLGYRLAGTPSDNAAALYIRDKLRGMGLSNVHLEKVPVDVWDVRGASLTVGDDVYTCSQFAGVPGVDSPLTADVVYVGSGLAADYEGRDVKGKIVLVDSSMDNFWFNFQGAEATKHGAAAVVLTSNYSDPNPDYPSFPWYSWAADALGGNDGEYDMSYAPMIYLSQKDGDALKSAILAADPTPVEATFASDVRITMASDGGFGYNVLATLPGSRHDGQKVILNAHHDSHLRAGLDDTGAVAETLALAKAMKLSGYAPKRDIVFLFDTAEEFGYTNAWYDWSIGAWTFITQAHPDWAGKIAAMWSIELMAREGATLDFNTAPELATWLDQNASAGKDSGLLPNGYKLETPQNTWQNGWSFQGTGVPSFEVSAGGKDYDLMYHSSYEVPAELDWDLMASIDKFFGKLFRNMDGGVLPYDFAARGDDLKAALDADELRAAGVSAASANQLVSAANSLAKKGATWNKHRAGIKSGNRATANSYLLRGAKTSLKGYQALDAWDYSCYPHQQTMWDIEYMDAALAHLQADPVAADAAIEDLGSVGINWYNSLFTPSVVDYELTRHDPDYYRVTWGAMGKQIDQFQMAPVWALIGDGHYDKAIAKVQKFRNADALDLQMRVQNMTTVTQKVNDRLDQLNKLK
ncbi:MAG TPA: M28 family peptidase [Thermoleophilia bacterium]